jgi:hypothetical protein
VRPSRIVDGSFGEWVRMVDLYLRPIPL